MLDKQLMAPAALAADPNYEFPSINGDELLQQVSEFIARYLQCSEHQRTLLALWILHTHGLSAAQVTPYLAIQSAEKQSGKTLCLQLLNLLCSHPALTAGFTANALTRRIDGPISTVLLDECQATVGTRRRSKSPVLRAILASGYHLGPGYMDATHERNAFAPKAFAGRGQLPEDIADRCIPIILQPLDESSELERFDRHHALAEAKPLQEQLHMWGDEYDPDLQQIAAYSRKDLPANLSPRRQDMIEPLLQLADFIGGNWPARIREALPEIFQEEAHFELRFSLQLLADIRDCFAHNNFPARMGTAAMLEWLHSLPARPWDADGPINARTIARLLGVFDIYPRVQRIGSDAPARGYQLEDFLPLWEEHLGFHPEIVTHAQQSEIANKDAVCNAVTDCGEVSVSKVKTNGKSVSPQPDVSESEEFPLEKPWASGPHIIPAAHETAIAALSAAS